MSPGYAINAKTKHLAAARSSWVPARTRKAVRLPEGDRLDHDDADFSRRSTRRCPTWLPLSVRQLLPAAGLLAHNSDALNAEAIAQLQQLAQGTDDPPEGRVLRSTRSFSP